MSNEGYVIDLIKETKKTLFSIEIVPPLKGNSIDKIYDVIDPLVDFNPSFINITYHKDEVEFKQLPTGQFTRKTIRKRPGTVALAGAIKHRYNVLVVPHITCGGFTKTETENALIDFSFLGIHNLLALRGDPNRNELVFMPEPDGHHFAVDLVRQIVDMNKGKYLDEDLKNPVPTRFSVGVAGYPEKHYQAPNMESDLQFLKEKVDAGADYIVTQMFFDNRVYFDFIEKCRNKGIHVPIIPGLKPIALLDQLTILPQIFKVDIPEDLAREIRKCKTNKEVADVGVEWCINQSNDLKSKGVPVLHFYTLGAGDTVRRVAKAVF